MSRRATIAGLLALLGACSSGADADADTGDDSGAVSAARSCWADDDVPLLTDLSLAHTTDIAVRVGDDGGIVGHAGLQVRLAAGAVPKGTEVRITHGGVPPGDFRAPASPLFLVEADVPIEGPVQACFVVEGASEDLDVQWSTLSEGWGRRPEPVVVAGQAVRASIRTWGSGFVSGPGPQTVALTDAPAKLDVLSVIDAGASMEAEQLQYARAFPALGDLLLGSGVDWHWGVVSGEVLNDDKRSGRLEAVGGRRFVSPSVPDPLAVHTALVRLGTDSPQAYRGLRALALALTVPTDDLRDANRGFRRPDAQLAVVFLSDEDDQSAPDTTRFEVLDLLAGSPRPPADARALAIVGPGPNGCTTSVDRADAGAQMIAVASGSGGVFQSICDDDWTEGFLAFARLFRGTACQRLAYAPDLDTLEVFDVGTDEVVDPEHWLYDDDDRCVGVTLPGLAEHDGATWGVRYAPGVD